MIGKGGGAVGTANGKAAGPCVGLDWTRYRVGSWCLELDGCRGCAAAAPVVGVTVVVVAAAAAVVAAAALAVDASATAAAGVPSPTLTPTFFLHWYFPPLWRHLRRATATGER